MHLLSITFQQFYGATLALLPILLLYVLVSFFKKSKRKIISTVVLAIVASGQLALFYWDASGFSVRHQIKGVEDILANPEDWVGKTQLNSENSLIALSFLSEGLVDYSRRFPETRAGNHKLIEKALAVMVGPELCPYHDVTDSSSWSTSENNLYLSHLNIILNCHKLTSSPSDKHAQYNNLYQRLSRYLAARLSASPTGNLPSYGGIHQDTLWVADNAVTIHSLWLYDRVQESELAISASSKWIPLVQSTEEIWHGLPYSELTSRRMPRGCANSWIAKYAVSFAPKQASSWWRTYKSEYKYNLGSFCLFREYPPNVILVEDYDSGPIVLGAGAAATGLALSGAKYQGDYYTYYQLLTALTLADLAIYISNNFSEDAWSEVSNNWLAKSIRFNAAARK